MDLNNIEENENQFLNSETQEDNIDENINNQNLQINDKVNKEINKEVNKEINEQSKNENQYRSVYQLVLDEILLMNGLDLKRIPFPVYKKLFYRFKLTMRKEIDAMINVGLFKDKLPLPKKSSVISFSRAEWNNDIIVLIERLNLKWINILNDLRNLQNLERNQSMESSKSENRSNSNDSIEQNDSRANEEMLQTFNLMKHEIQQSILSNFQTFSLYEFQSLLDSILAYISHKELQYRRIPRKIIENYIEKYIPTIDNTAASSKASFISFILNQIRRIKESQGKKIDLKLTGRLIAAIFSEVMTRYVVPLPIIKFVDDEIENLSETDPLKDNRDLSIENNSIYWNQPSEKMDYFTKKYRFLKTMISFKQNFEEYSQFDINNKSFTTKKKAIYAYSHDIANLIHLSSELKNRNDVEQKHSIQVLRLDQGSSSTSFLGSRSHDLRKGLVGPLNFNLPLFRNPLKYLNIIKISREICFNRLKSIEKILLLWRSLDAESKKIISSRIKERLNVIHNIYRLRRLVRQLSSRDIDDSEALQTYEELYTNRVIHYSKLFHNNGTLHKKYSNQFLKIPEFLSDFSNWTKEDLLMFNNSDSFYYFTLQERWVDDLRKKFHFLNDISLGSFKQQIQSGSIGKYDITLQLLALIKEKKENKIGLERDDNEIEVLYNWLRFGYPKESLFKKRSAILKQLLEYIIQDAEIKLDQMEEYFLKEIIIKKNNFEGYHFALSFVRSLRSIYEGDGEILKILPLDMYTLERNREIKKNAFEELDTIIDQHINSQISLNHFEEKNLLDSQPMKNIMNNSIKEKHNEKEQLNHVLHDQEVAIHYYKHHWQKLFSESRFNSLQRLSAYNHVKSSHMREEEERIQMEYDLNLASLPIPNRSVISSNHYTWLQGMRSSWK